MHKAAVIIVNWNGKHLLKECLDSVFAQTYQNFDVYFIDNGSTDGSFAFVKENYPKIKLIQLKENTGFAKGNNVGIKQVLKDKQVQYIALLNNDTRVDAEWLGQMVLTAEKYEKCGMVSPKTILPDGKLHTIGLSLFKDLLGRGIGGCSLGFGENPEKYDQEMEIFAPAGVAPLYKREMLEEIGLFDERFFAYSEDLDLGFRARICGWKSVYRPGAKLIHYHSQTGVAASPFKAFHIKRNNYFVAIKNFSLKDLLFYPLRDMRWNVRSFFEKSEQKSSSKLKGKIGLGGIIRVMFKAYWQVLLTLPGMIKKRRAIQKNKKISTEEYEKLFTKIN